MRQRLLTWWRRRQSLRWRLPLSYAAIALLATVSLGILLLTILRGHYQRQELDYLRDNAQAIGAEIAPALRADDRVALQNQITSYAFLSQARIEVLDGERQHVLADSGQVGAFSVSTPGLSGENALSQPGDSPRLATDDDRTVLLIESENEVEENLGENVEVRITSDGVTTTTTAITRTNSLRVGGTPFGFGLGETAVIPPRSDLTVEYLLTGENGETMGVLRLSQGPAYGREIVGSVAESWIIASIVAVVLAALAGWLVSRHLTQPLLALTAVTGEMAQGDFSSRADVGREDELGLLGRSFNRMADRVEGTVRTLRRFVADAAHELNTPLTALDTDLSLLADAATDPLTRERVARAQAQATRLQTLTESLLDLSRIEAEGAAGKRPPLNLTALVRMVSEPYASRAEQRGLTFTLQAPETAVYVPGNESQLKQALGNLLDNSLKFTPPPGRIRVLLTAGEAATAEKATITVTDTGIGIPAEDLPHLFARFHRGRNTADYAGNGLGLAIVEAIVRQHDGKITVQSGKTGAQITLTLPLA